MACRDDVRDVGSGDGGSPVRARVELPLDEAEFGAEPLSSPAFLVPCQPGHGAVPDDGAGIGVGVHTPPDRPGLRSAPLLRGLGQIPSAVAQVDENHGPPGPTRLPVDSRSSLGSGDMVCSAGHRTP